MRIDDRIEDHVRKALHAVLRRSPALLEQAAHAFADAASRTEGYRLACAITAVMVHDLRQRPPTPAEVDGLATTVAAAAHWSGVAAVEVRALLAVITGQAGRAGAGALLPAHRLGLVCFVTAGSLLLATGSPDEPWWEQLDRVEARVEAMI